MSDNNKIEDNKELSNEDLNNINGGGHLIQGDMYVCRKCHKHYIKFNKQCPHCGEKNMLYK